MKKIQDGKKLGSTTPIHQLKFKRACLLLDKHIKLRAFSFASTSVEAFGGTEGQIAGLGQGSKLKEALHKRKRSYQNIEHGKSTEQIIGNFLKW